MSQHKTERESLSSYLLDITLAKLELALDAHGGLTRWRQVKSTDLKLSIGGPLWQAKGLPQGLNVALHVEPSKKLVVVSPFDGEDSTGYFTPDRVWVENAAGTVVQKLTSPRGSFSGHDLMTPWSKLQELYFVGYAFLNYLSSPFNLAEPGPRPGTGVSALPPDCARSRRRHMD